jgi:hypothetical protein
MKKALVILVLLSFCQSWMQASRARAANKSSCESCPVPGVDFKSTTALKAATKSSGCKVGKGNAGLPVQDPACTPGAINETVTADLIKSGHYRTGCVRNCLSTQSEKGIEYNRYGVKHDRATCELDHLVPLELGGADSLDNIWPQCGPFGATGMAVYFKQKDKVEDYLTTMVKTGKMPLREAQAGIAKDWTQYRDAALKYCAANKCGSEQ